MKPPSRTTSSRILLVRLRQIGDVVFTTPAVHALRRHFPGAHLAYLVEPAAASVVRHNPHLDDVIVAPRGRGFGGFLSDLALGRRLRAARYDVAIDFHGGPRASLLTWLSGARVRLGYEIAGRGWMYTDRVARPRELRRRHSVENQWDLLTPLGITAPDREQDPVEMVADAGARGRVDARLADARLSPADTLIVVHVSAGNPFRRWPVPHFVELIRALVTADPHRAVVITSGPSEADAAARHRRRPRGARRGRRRPRAVMRRALARRAAGDSRSRRALHRRRQRAAPHRGRHARADRRSLRSDAPGAVGAPGAAPPA